MYSYTQLEWAQHDLFHVTYTCLQIYDLELHILVFRFMVYLYMACYLYLEWARHATFPFFFCLSSLLLQQKKRKKEKSERVNETIVALQFLTSVD